MRRVRHHFAVAAVQLQAAEGAKTAPKEEHGFDKMIMQKLHII